MHKHYIRCYSLLTFYSSFSDNAVKIFDNFWKGLEVAEDMEGEEHLTNYSQGNEGMMSFKGGELLGQSRHQQYIRVIVLLHKNQTQESAVRSGRMGWGVSPISFPLVFPLKIASINVPYFRGK